MKKIIIVLLLFTVSTSALAMREGWLIGVQAGRSETDFSARSLNIDTLLGMRLGGSKPSTDNNGAGGRVFLGYQFNKFFAAETGFSKYEKTTIDNVFGVSGAEVELSPQAGDIVGKAIIPFSKTWSVFGKAGAALVHVSSDSNAIAKNITSPIGDPRLPSSDNKWRPTYGFGISCSTSKEVSIDLGWNRIQGNDAIEDINLASIGLTLYLG